MSRIIAYGCSNTYGEGLPDCWVKNNAGPNPSKFAWPHLLADKMNLECINLSKPACSIKYMANKVLETKFREDDIVVFMWTYFSRYCFFQDNGLEKRLLINDIENKGLDSRNRRYSRKYYQTFHTNENAIIDGYMRINFIKNYLDSKDIINHHYTCHEATKGFNLREPNWSIVKIPNIRFSFLDKALDNVHPGIESQKQLAKEIYEDITVGAN